MQRDEYVCSLETDADIVVTTAGEIDESIRLQALIFSVLLSRWYEVACVEGGISAWENVFGVWRVSMNSPSA